MLDYCATILGFQNDWRYALDSGKLMMAGLHSLRTFRAYGRGRESVRRRGIGMAEVLVVVGILAVLVSILIPAVSRARSTSRNVGCVSKLRNIGSALQTYAMDHSGKYPDPGLVDQSWEQMIREYYTGTFDCPADYELFPAVGSSYEWRDTGKETTTMAGRSIADVRRTDAVLVMESLPGWHAKNSINVFRIDGSAMSMDQQLCFQDLAKPIRAGKD